MGSLLREQLDKISENTKKSLWLLGNRTSEEGSHPMNAADRAIQIAIVALGVVIIATVVIASFLSQEEAATTARPSEAQAAMPGTTAATSPGPATPWIAAAGAVGAAVAGTFAAALVTARKDRDIARLTRDKDVEIAQLRVRLDLEIEYDKDLRTRRIEYYIELWSCLLPLARYPEAGPLSYDNVQQLSLALRDWYFKGGGLFMSRETRNKYFDLQDGLKIILQKRQGRWPWGCENVSEAQTKYRLRKHLRSGEEWEIPKEVLTLANSNIHPYKRPWAPRANVPPKVFEKLRSLGSSLRSSLAQDVLTRETSRLYSPPPAGRQA
jgi:hypothetical protein